MICCMRVTVCYSFWVLFSGKNDPANVATCQSESSIPTSNVIISNNKLLKVCYLNFATSHHSTCVGNICQPPVWFYLHSLFLSHVSSPLLFSLIQYINTCTSCFSSLLINLPVLVIKCFLLNPLFYCFFIFCFSSNQTPPRLTSHRLCQLAPQQLFRLLELIPKPWSTRPSAHPDVYCRLCLLSPSSSYPEHGFPATNYSP